MRRFDPVSSFYDMTLRRHREELEVFVFHFCFGPDKSSTLIIEVGFLDNNSARKPDAILLGSELRPQSQAELALVLGFPFGEYFQPAGRFLDQFHLEDIGRRGVNPGLSGKAPSLR